MPTVVIDTGILVSAALRDRDPEKVVLWIIAQPDWVWNATDEILAEYRDVLGRPKFKLTTSQLE